MPKRLNGVSLRTREENLNTGSMPNLPRRKEMRGSWRKRDVVKQDALLNAGREK